MIRQQYHFRNSEQGLLAWDVRRLIELSEDLPVFDIEIEQISELDENHWYAHAGKVPSCRSIIEHARLIDGADLRYAIILDAQGRVMDGMHRASHTRSTTLHGRFAPEARTSQVGGARRRRLTMRFLWITPSLQAAGRVLVEIGAREIRPRYCSTAAHTAGGRPGGMSLW